MIIALALRGFQLLIAAAILIVASILIHGFGPGHPPSIIDYASFCGGAGLIIAAIGVLSLFIDKLQGIIMLVLDGFATFFLLAGAAAYAAKVRSGNCKDLSGGGYVSTLNGVINVSNDKYYSDNENKAISMAETDLENRCRMVQAESAFLWILVICYIGTIVISFFGRSGKLGGAIV